MPPGAREAKYSVAFCWHGCMLQIFFCCTLWSEVQLWHALFLLSVFLTIRLILFLTEFSNVFLWSKKCLVTPRSETDLISLLIVVFVPLGNCLQTRKLS